MNEIELILNRLFSLNLNWKKKQVRYEIWPENIPAAIETFDGRESILGEEAAVHRSPRRGALSRFLGFFNFNDESLLRHDWIFSFSSDWRIWKPKCSELERSREEREDLKESECRWRLAEWVCRREGGGGYGYGTWLLFAVKESFKLNELGFDWSTKIPDLLRTFSIFHLLLHIFQISLLLVFTRNPNS